MMYLLGHELLCAVEIYKPHLKSTSIIAVSQLCLLGQPWEERLQHVYCYSCCTSQERINAFACLQLLASSSRLLSHALPTPGSVNSVNSVNSNTTGIKNRVSDRHNITKLNLLLEKTLESPLDCKEIQPVHSKGDKPWDFFGRNDAKAETPVLWPPHANSWLIEKDSDAGRDWGQEEKGKTEDEMDGWHHQLNGHESVWTLGVGDGQGGLACCNSWGCKESDTTEWLNWTELKPIWSSSLLLVSTLISWKQMPT